MHDNRHEPVGRKKNNTFSLFYIFPRKLKFAFCYVIVCLLVCLFVWCFFFVIVVFFLYIYILHFALHP